MESIRRALTLLCLAGVAHGCASDEAGVAEVEAGSVRVMLTLSDGSEIATVQWEITGGELSGPMSGVITVNKGATVSASIGGIPVGNGYNIAMTAVTDRGVDCAGDAGFDIAGPGALALLDMTLSCGGGQSRADGDLAVNADVNECPRVNFSVSPLRVRVGSSTELSATATDENGDPLVYSWSSTVGPVAPPDAAEASLTCNTVGRGLVTLVVDDGHDCNVTRRAPITCLAGPDADDRDGDGVVDTTDNCPTVANSAQGDMDGDGLGDVCDPDFDGDGVENLTDNCPGAPNADQLDTDGDGAGNACDAVDCAIAGNIEADALPTSGSVAFVLVDGEYQFIRHGAMEDTSISFIDSRCEFAYGWSRDKPWSDDTAVESSWVLNLETMEFQTIDIPGAAWVIARNATDDGRIVGKLALDNGTPDDPSDDLRRGFVHDITTGQTAVTSREGFGDIGFTAIRDDGLITGFNDFGMLGFVYSDGQFFDLTHPDAFRLFPFQINASGTVVGFWGKTADNWYDNSISSSFVAEWDDGVMEVRRFDLPGKSGTGLSALNDAGQIAGIAYSFATSLPVVFTAETLEATPVFHPLPGTLEPFVTGLSTRGVAHGQAFILQEPPVCGGHGSLEGDICQCDEGYEVDPVDPANCLAPDAECSGHGHLHGSECHCDRGYSQAPGDPSKCVPE